MTSPSNGGVIQPARPGGVRVAFYGRVARDDDPHAAIQHQLRAVTAALPSETPIVEYFADVGPWNGLRGSKHATATPNLGGHPVDGGLIDLLDRARRPDRNFDVIACADADQLSRRLIDRVRIEDNLAAYGVRVVTANDPNIATPHLLDTHDTTQKRLRRWAWDVVTAETSHRSREVRDRMRAEGWHIGPTPYGYVTETLMVARQRRRRLVSDPVRAGVVRAIFTFRVHPGLGATAIARTLTADPSPPAFTQPDKPNDARPWSAAVVRAILANSVYTGHLVSNRVRADRRLRPIDEWTWSPTPVHEPVIALDTFLAAQPIATIRPSSPDDHGHNSVSEPTPQQPRNGDRP